MQANSMLQVIGFCKKEHTINELNVSKSIFCYALGNMFLQLQAYNTTAQEVTPQVSLDIYKCPFSTCDFVSDRRFSGIRNHLLKHFAQRIEHTAKSLPILDEREKSNCMSRTGMKEISEI